MSSFVILAVDGTISIYLNGEDPDSRELSLIRLIQLWSWANVQIRPQAKSAIAPVDRSSFMFEIMALPILGLYTLYCHQKRLGQDLS